MESKILILDDEKSVIMQVKELLDSFGYKSSYIPHSKFLLKRLETEEFDLLLLDINMPGDDGITILTELKAHPVFCQMPVIMMTGDTNDSTLETCFAKGAADYITKPISEPILRARVRAVVQNQQQKRLIEEQRNAAELKNEELRISEDKIRKAHANIGASINYAMTIQRAVIPQQELLDELLHDNFVLFKVRDVVSGDFYWVKQQNDLVYIAVADCTGHGVPGALLSMLGISFLNEIVFSMEKENAKSPAAILEKLRDKVKMSLGQTGKIGERRDGMDIALCIIDTKKAEILFAGAYNPFVLIRNTVQGEATEMIYIKGDKQPISAYPKEKAFTNHSISIVKGDRVYLFTDGFADQIGGGERRKYFSKDFRQLLSDIQSCPLGEQKTRMEKAFDEWKGDCEQIDDVLVIGFEPLG